jgi:hypothetical protein
MQWTGGCLCGDVRYQVSQDPEWVGSCHCTMCRKISGTAFSTYAVFSRETFEWTKGVPALYRSSEPTTRGFCARCGSTLSWETTEIFGVAVGSLDRPEDVQPECHTNTTTWLPWIKMDDDLPRLEGSH